MEQPYHRPAQVPRGLPAPHQPGGGEAYIAGARAHTHTKGTWHGTEGQ